MRLTWLKPAITGKGSLLYVVEIRKDGIGKWKQAHFTAQLETTLVSPSLDDHVRVCAKNDIQRNNLACSRSYRKFRVHTVLYRFGTKG